MFLLSRALLICTLNSGHSTTTCTKFYPFVHVTKKCGLFFLARHIFSTPYHKLRKKQTKHCYLMADPFRKLEKRLVSWLFNFLKMQCDNMYLLCTYLLWKLDWIYVYFFLQKFYFRPSSDPLSRAVIDGIEAAGGKYTDYEVVTTPQLHYFVVCENTKEEYGVPSKEGYFKKLSQAFMDFKKMVLFY